MTGSGSISPGPSDLSEAEVGPACANETGETQVNLVHHRRRTGRFLRCAGGGLAGARPGDDPLAAVASGLILLPTRRAARSLAEAFLAQVDGRPLLLPRITALGALDEAPLPSHGALSTLPPGVAPLRLAHLARLVMAMDGRFGAPATIDRAWPLAAELAALMDEAERAEIDLAAVLPGPGRGGLCRSIGARRSSSCASSPAPGRRGWTEQGLMNPAARQVALLDAQARAWEACAAGD